MATRREVRKNETPAEAANADPITNEPGAHPVSVGVGTALGGAAAGALGGAVAGPVGAVVGAVAGGIAGGLGGKAAGEQIDPTVETNYWKTQYPTRDYYNEKIDYQAVEPAYRYGWESRSAYEGKTFEQAEKDLEAHWQERRGGSKLVWSQARPATRDAWQRIDNAFGKSPSPLG
ncbi:hypothetical protein SH661x_001859 [Planctomicrobium sp. SH661]|uniref:hypothetical protein n=1 Tax=Planctomicrobium sp. SH661 TaxID=3448124 RepID=UPI003F5B2C7F